MLRALKDFLRTIQCTELILKVIGITKIRMLILEDLGKLNFNPIRLTIPYFKKICRY